MNSPADYKPAAPEPVVKRGGPPLMPGRGTRLFSSYFGQSLSASSGGGNWLHPFTPQLGTRTIKLTRGLVDRYEPKIGGVPISGSARKSAPALKLEPAIANADGESWVCVEVEPQENGRLGDKSRVEIVHSNDPQSRERLIGRQPLVLILWRNARPVKAFEIAFFNMRYRRVEPASGVGPVEHLFF